MKKSRLSGDKHVQSLTVQQQDKQTIASIEQLDDSQLPAGDVTVAVKYSSLNYKDGLAITGKGKIVRQWPMVPGIDFAGQVLESTDARYKAGDEIVLTGWGVGEGHWGGMAEKARVSADWLAPLTTGLTALQAMQIGTAGLTAMLCVMALEEAGITPEQGDIFSHRCQRWCGLCGRQFAGRERLPRDRRDRTRSKPRVITAIGCERGDHPR